MNRTAAIAVLAALASGPALAQTTVEEEDVIVVDPEQEAEIVEPEVEVETVEEVEVVEAEAVEARPMGDTADLIRSRDITGGPVYSTGEELYDDARWAATDPFDATRTGAYESYGYDDNYDQIGSIEDVVLDSSGQMVGVVAEIGGFLDIGDKHVMLPLQDVRLTPVDDSSFAYVTRLTEEQLEELPSVDEGPLD